MGYPSDATSLLTAEQEVVTQSLDHWAHAVPTKVFIHDGESDRRWTYAEVAGITDTIAGNLAARGIGKGDRVCTLLNDPLTATLWMFGIWKAAAVYCPINPGYFGELLSYQINDTAPRFLITEAALVGSLADVADDLREPPTVVLCPPFAESEGATPVPAADYGLLTVLGGRDFLVPAEAPGHELSYSDIANIIYTSGTTGRSKGVVQSYRWMNQYTSSTRVTTSSDDIIYSDLPMFHVGAAFFNVARAAWAGAGVSLWPKFSSSQFWDRIDRSGATMATLVGVMAPWLMNNERTATDHVNTLNKVHMQPLPRNHREIAQRFGFDFVSSGFGQTESGSVMQALIEECAQGEGTPDSCYRGLRHDEIRQRYDSMGLRVLDGSTALGHGLMGQPQAYLEVAVHDEHDNPCPVGTPGQLVIRPKAPSVIAEGYLGKPRETVEAWKNLWFHTGDMVYVDEQGLWYFVDRKGDRIRRRGENVSTQHLEELIGKYAGITVVAAFPVPSQDQSEDDIVVCVQGEGLDLDDLRAWIETTIPHFMRPQHVVGVDSIPTTPTGKIQRFKMRENFLREQPVPHIVHKMSRP